MKARRPVSWPIHSSHKRSTRR